MAQSPPAMERQRRSATRKSCTGSAASSVPARSHSSRTRSIQYARPMFGLAFPAAVIANSVSPATVLSHSRVPGCRIPVTIGPLSPPWYWLFDQWITPVLRDFIGISVITSVMCGSFAFTLRLGITTTEFRGTAYSHGSYNQSNQQDCLCSGLRP